MTKQELHDKILSLVREYCDTYHAPQPWREGDRLPYASRVYDHEEMENLVDSALEFWLTSGRYVKAFEQQLAAYLGVRFASVVNSGSSANLLAFMTLTSPLLGERRIQRGDEVITVAAGFPTTVAPIVNYGAVPVFVDVTIPQYNIDVTKLEAALSEKTKAVMIAHTLGNPFDLKAVKAFCDKHNLWLVEDNCDALGTQFCRRCNYCAPCTVGISIPSVFLFQGYLNRYGLQQWGRERYATLQTKAGACIRCGACEPRCPYNLPIRKMMKKAAEDFGE